MLLAFAFKAFYALLFSDGVGLVDHPDEPESAEDVSIWKLPLVASLTRCEDVVLHHATQGYHGSEGLKPTGLLALRLPDLPECLQHWKLADWHVQGQTTGRNEAGEYRSAKSKEYPPALCGGIAASMSKALGQCPIDATVQYPDSFTSLCKKLTASSRGAGIGLDTCKDG